MARNVRDAYLTSGADSYEEAIARIKESEKQDQLEQKKTIPILKMEAEELEKEWVIPIETKYDLSHEKHEHKNLNKDKELPIHLMNIGGLIGEVAKHTYENAPVPNKVLAFVGSLALMSYLVGRKVKGISGVRPNMYLLGLGFSTSGKDFARKVNDEILHEIGKADEIGESVSSSEGLEDALQRNSILLLQTDEIDGMLESIKSGKEIRYEKIMGSMLKLYTSSSSHYKMRLKAGQESIGSIKEPSLTLFGTAVPTYYYNALSEKMLNNGFFGRMLVFQGYKAEQYREVDAVKVPESILSIARFWRSFNSNLGNLGDKFYCNPIQVKHTPDCKKVIKDFSDKVFAIKSKHEDAGNNGAVTVWGRALENAFKLSLLRACSEVEFADANNTYILDDPIITKEILTWSIELIEFLINNMMSSIEGVTGDDPVRINAKKVFDLIVSTKKGYTTRTWVKRKSNLSTKILDEAIKDLVDDKLIEVKNGNVNGSRLKSIVYVIL